LKPQKSHA